MNYNTHIPKFRRFVLQNFPFIEQDFDALTDYQLISKVVEYLNDVIHSQNALVSEMERYEEDMNSNFARLENLFNELHDYVENYFDNLDVQEEINNKLEEMAEDGYFQDIINSYINNYVPRCYETVADMINDNALKESMIVLTSGYYNKNDGGGSKYLIVSSEPIGSVYETLNNGKYALQIIEDYINLNKCGCYGDGIHDDTNKIKSLINIAKSKKLRLTANHNSIFLISSSLDVSNLYIDFNYATFITNSAIDMFVVDSTEYYGEIKNITIDCNGVANSGIKLTTCRKLNISYIDIINIKTYGLQYLAGYEVNASHMNFQGTTTDNSIGIYATSGDSKFSDIIMIDCKTAIYNINGSNYYDSIHAWILTPALIVGSICFKFNAGNCFLNNCYSDTYQYSIYQTTQIPSLSINNFFNVYNHGIYTAETAISATPVFMYCESANGNALTRISNSIIMGYSSTTNTHLTNLSSFEGSIVNCKITNFDHNLPFSNIDVTGSGVSSVSASKLEKDDKLVCIEHRVNINNISDTKTFTVGTIPYYFRPTIEYIGMCSYGTGSYNVQGVAYVYISVAGVITVTLPSDVTGNVTLKINVKYLTHKEI